MASTIEPVHTLPTTQRQESFDDKKDSYPVDQTPASPQFDDVLAERVAELQPGVAKVELAQKLWTKKTKWILYICLGLATWASALDGATAWQFLTYATSEVFQHSLSGTVSTAAGIVTTVIAPSVAKSADTFGRAETYTISIVLYSVGYWMIGSAHGIGQIAGGTVLYSAALGGLNVLYSIVLADVTTLRWRTFYVGLLSLPYILNVFISAEMAEAILPNWRWGYYMFAIMVPVLLIPVAGVLFWSQWKAKKQLGGQLESAVPAHPSFLRNPVQAAVALFHLMDIVGLILLSASLSMILLPFTLATTAVRGWQTPSIIVLIVLGFVLLPVFVVWELKFARHPMAPLRLITNKNIIAACLIGQWDFISFYLQYTYQYAFVLIIKTEWNTRASSYFQNTQTFGIISFAFFTGIYCAYVRRYKWLMFNGLLLRMLGCGIMIHARGALGSDFELVACQLLQGMGGGIAQVLITLSAQASVKHEDVASVIALVLLLTEVGRGFGTAIATAVWTNSMPQQLAKNIPSANATVIAEIYGNVYLLSEMPADSPVRIGAIAAYSHVMRDLCIAATVTSIVPILACYFWTENHYLGDVQNAVEGRANDGEKVATGLEDEREAAQRGTV